jgi:signal transduction histidine kinase
MSKTLQQKNTRQLTTRLLAILVAGSLVFYVLMLLQGRHMQRELLEMGQLNYQKAFTSGSGMPMAIRGVYTITIVANSQPESEPADTMLVMGTALRPFKKLSQTFFYDGKFYLLTTYISSREISHLIIKAFLIEAALFIGLLTAIVYTNRRSSASLWAPFRDTLKKLSEYDITRSREIDLPEQTGIQEFDELNLEVSHLLEKVNSAYLNQKQFVENASHEIQTPLAIIRSKLELMINQPALTEATAILLADITEASERLSQMNKNLLLLAKIENNQYPHKTSIDATALLLRTIENFRTYYEDEFPALVVAAEEQVTITANQSLMDILFSNLIKNAIIHNIPSGYIHIQLDHSHLQIANSGPALEGAPELLFERFQKGGDENRSTGLGLAIVKQICQVSGFIPSYAYAGGRHTVTVSLQPADSP